MAAGNGDDDGGGPGTDASVLPAIDGGPGVACYGPSGAWQVCLSSAPSGAITLPATIDTDGEKPSSRSIFDASIA